jgi:hypothetical protein
MERKSSRTPEKNPDLSVQKVLAEFRKSEESTAHRKGTFKIDMPFEDALKIVAHAKPASKSTRADYLPSGRRTASSRPM